MEDEVFLKDGKIELSQESIAYWAKKWDCDEATIKSAIHEIGNSYNVLVLYLQMNGWID